mgnify:CR=1 FL=1
MQKKDPLILPPNFDELPLPDADPQAEIEVSSFEETLKENTAILARDNADVFETTVLWKMLAIGFAILWAGTLLIWFFNRNK